MILREDIMRAFRGTKQGFSHDLLQSVPERRLNEKDLDDGEYANIPV
jgi:hypothetical protein